MSRGYAIRLSPDLLPRDLIGVAERVERFEQSGEAFTYFGPIHNLVCGNAHA
jgi:hypothetical protein